jgi:ribulose-phosphate 3-epimerase
MVKIVPAVLSTKEEDFERDIKKVLSAQALQNGWVHIDFMDNIFVPNLSIDPSVIAKYDIPLKKEAHPMAAYPLQWVDKLADAGFDRIIFHLEAKDDTLEVIEAIKGRGLEAGIAINIDTPIESLEPFKDKIELALIMAIVPGFQGQPFLPESLEKIKILKDKGWKVIVSVDGAVRDENAKQLVEAGVDQLTVGSFLLKGNIDENIEKIWEAIQS